MCQYFIYVINSFKLRNQGIVLWEIKAFASHSSKHKCQSNKNMTIIIWKSVVLQREKNSMLLSQTYPPNILVENFRWAHLFTGRFRIEEKSTYLDWSSKRINKHLVKIRDAIESTVHVAARISKESRRARLTDIKEHQPLYKLLLREDFSHCNYRQNV